MKPTRQASVATSSNQCFLRRYTMQLRFGTAMSFDNRLIAARCIGGAWSLGEAHSQNERYGTAAVGAERAFGWRNKSARGHSRSGCACASANVGHEATASMKSVSLHEANVRSHLGHLKQSLMTRRFLVTFMTSS